MGEKIVTQIIAELCQNHMGDTKLLKKMVEECAEAGAAYCKIQSIDSSELTFREKFEQGLIDKSGNTIVIKRPFKEEKERLDSLNLSIEQQKLFVDECRKNGIKPLTTIFTKGQIKNYEMLAWGHKTVKIASYDCGSIPLLSELIDVGVDDFIISTGATFNYEIEKTCKFLSKAGVTFSLLHCVTIYPTQLNTGHINRINFLRRYTQDVGFSDHSSYEKDWLKLSLLSAYAGASHIERHFTSVDKPLTRDGKVSLDYRQMKELVELVRLPQDQIMNSIMEKSNKEEITAMMGSEDRSLSSIELLNRDYYRGRFATKNEEGKYSFNWEKTI